MRKRLKWWERQRKHRKHRCSDCALFAGDETATRAPCTLHFEMIVSADRWAPGCFVPRGAVDMYFGWQWDSDFRRTF